MNKRPNIFSCFSTVLHHYGLTGQKYQPRKYTAKHLRLTIETVTNGFSVNGTSKYYIIPKKILERNIKKLPILTGLDLFLDLPIQNQRCVLRMRGENETCGYGESFSTSASGYSKI